MRRHTIVISDVHLSQAHPVDDTDPLWMRYRRSAYHPDADVQTLIAQLETACTPGSLEFVCNGDVFDFDAPLVEHGESTAREYPNDEAGCADQMRRILADHPGFVAALGQLLVRGQRIMFLSGNHDVELYFTAVRQVLRDALVSEAVRQGAQASQAALQEGIRFRTWFHRTRTASTLNMGASTT
jgi:UDP-2,3-diacylglucosamine pyrophosphatase LpxH